MKTRKLQEVGGGSYTVSMPKDWVDEQCLEAGETIYLYRHLDGSIVVRDAEKDAGPLSVATLTLTDEDTAAVERLLHVANVAGFGHVILQSTGGFDDHQRRGVSAALRDIAGATVRSETNAEIRVHFAIDATEVSIRQSIEHLRFLALSIHRQATAAFLEADGEGDQHRGDHLAEVRRVREMIAHHCNRSLVSFEELDRLGHSRPALFDANETARQLDRIADAGVQVAERAGDLSRPPPESLEEDFRSLADDTRQAVNDATAAALDGQNAEEAHAVIGREAALLEAIDDLEERYCRAFESEPYDPADVVAIGNAATALKRTARAATSIAGVALRSAIRPTEDGPTFDRFE